jgi:pimeloyl-ACP methyl ester carboxylesterase
VFRSKGNVALDYCLETPANLAPDVLVLYLHGLGGNARAWQEYDLTRELSRELTRRGLTHAVLTPSFGPFWLLKETPTATGEPPLLPVVEELLEDTRARFPPELPVVMVGTSLGGYNGLQFWFKRPWLFRAAAFAGPAVADASPLGQENDIVRDYVTRSRAREGSARTLVRRTRDAYVDAADWARHDPLALAREMGRGAPAPDALPPLLLQVGHEDHFGFQLGTGILQNTLRTNGFPVEYSLLSGGRGVFEHVVLQAPQVAEFLARSVRRP